MIPKKIHYCWFGRGEKTKLAKKCIDSWKRQCPDYEIVEWNEDNFDIDQYPYLHWCYEQKKWAFLTDFIRLLIINQNGGFYFDTDVELVRNLDDLIHFEAVYGFENNEYVNTGEGFGSEAGHPIVVKMIELYKNMQPNQDGSFTLVGCPHLNTEALISFGLERNGKRQNIGGVEVFPADYFNPYDSSTGKLNITKDTISIHWYAGSWLSPKQRIRSTIGKPLHRIFGRNFMERFRK